jgi:exosortase/archaeosortase family protein
MLFTFIAMTTGVAMVIRRPWLDRAVIVASAVPIALIANVSRIVATGTLHELVDDRTANLIFHDLAGWLMMPLALGLMAIELELMSRLFVAPTGVPSTVAVDAQGRPADRPRRDGRKPENDAVRQALRVR